MAWTPPVALLSAIYLLSVIAAPNSSDDLNRRELEERKTDKSSVCKTKWTGVLSTAQYYDVDEYGNTKFTGKWGHYSFNSQKEIVYWGDKVKKPTIAVEFQTCYPNYYGSKNNQTAGDDLAGRIYVPSLKKCLAVENPQNNGHDFTESGPYYVKAKPCPAPTWSKTSIPFNFVWFNFEDYYHPEGTPHQLAFIGKTSGRTGEVQGTCYSGGSMGYIHDGYGVPENRKRQYANQTASRNFKVPLICDEDESTRTNGCFTELTPVPRR